MVEMCIGHTPKWFAIWVRVMFLACRAGLRSLLSGTVERPREGSEDLPGDGSFE